MLTENFNSHKKQKNSTRFYVLLLSIWTICSIVTFIPIVRAFVWLIWKWFIHFILYMICCWSVAHVRVWDKIWSHISRLIILISNGMKLNFLSLQNILQTIDRSPNVVSCKWNFKHPNTLFDLFRNPDKKLICNY